MASGQNLNELRELVEFLKANDIAEFELEREDMKVALKFASAIVQPVPKSVGLDPATLAQIMGSAGSAPMQHLAVVLGRVGRCVEPVRTSPGTAHWRRSPLAVERRRWSGAEHHDTQSTPCRHVRRRGRHRS